MAEGFNFQTLQTLQPRLAALGKVPPWPGGTSPRTGKRKPATVFSIGGVETTEAGTKGRVKYEEEEGQMGDKPLLGMAEWFRVSLNGLKGLKNKPFSHFCTGNQRKRRGG